MKKSKILIFTILISLIIICFVLYISNIEKSKREIDKNVGLNNNEEDIDYEIVDEETDIDRTSLVPSDDENVKKISYNTYFAISSCIAINTENISVITDIKSIIVDKVNSYTVNVIEVNEDYEYLKNKFYVVYLDYANATFLIEDVTDKYNNFEEIQVKEIDNIEDNGSNRYSQEDYSEDYKYRYIFQNMKRLILAKPELAYEYLDEEYKAKRFGSYNRFLEYIKNNREHLIGIRAKHYKINDDNTQIILQDQYQNIYEFNMIDTMKYTAKIDNYIVMNKSDIEQYKKYTVEEKIKYNIKRWIKMINSKDYDVAYNFLDKDFRNDNYPSVEQFAEFMRNKYTDWYDNVSIKLQQEGNTYTAKVELSIDGEEFSDKYITIYMQLEEDTDFIMSFNVN